MHAYADLDKSQLQQEFARLTKEYDEIRSLNLSLDMTRGKPCVQQLDLAKEMLTILGTTDVRSKDGSDCRNYGVPFGIIEARELFAEILGTTAEHVIIGNNSSLNMMFDTLMRAVVFGEANSERPWSEIKNRKWLCPVPGYDRHFLVTERLGFELISVPLLPTGPDMDVVERIVASDPDVKGIWCIPVYSNPDGYVFSEETCKRLASMKTAASDFRIFWDNAYVVHHLYNAEKSGVPDILSLCEASGNPDRVYEFASTSKVTYAGAGISCMAANATNLSHAKKILSVQSIGPDKVNELRHARYLPDMDAVDRVMRAQADVIRPKFEKTLAILDEELSFSGVAQWNKPTGGYFVSLYVMPGTATEVVSLSKAAGVALTPAGATYPYGKDPTDSNIRIAPTFPSMDDVDKAIRVLCTCVRLSAVKKLLEEESL